MVTMSALVGMRYVTSLLLSMVYLSSCIIKLINLFHVSER
jgi:hypothetical protein